MGNYIIPTNIYYSNSFIIVVKSITYIEFTSK